MLPDCLKIILPQSWKHCKQHPHSVEVSRFAVTHILGEMNFGESRSSKTANLAIFWDLDFVTLVNISLQKVQKFIKIKIQSL